MSAPLELTTGPATIYSLLGPFAVLLAVERSKKPVRIGWQNIRFGDTQSERYQAELHCAPSIGVRLGEPSNGVVALDLDDDSWIERLLALNPPWRETLRTKGARGCQIWMRMRLGGAGIHRESSDSKLGTERMLANGEEAEVKALFADSIPAESDISFSSSARPWK